MGTLKPFTRYQCPSGHESRWTGAYRRPRSDDDQCFACGSTLIEAGADGRRWRVAFEIVSASTHPELYVGDRPAVDPAAVDESCWHPVSRETDSEIDARQQYEGLLGLAAQGEFVRDVRLEEATAPQWREVSS